MDYSILNITQFVCCLLLMILSTTVIGPLASVMQRFNNTCFIGVNLVMESGIPVVLDTENSSSACIYPEFIGVVSLLFALCYLGWLGCLLFNSSESTWREGFIGTCLSILMMILTLISSSVLTHGLSKICSTLGRGKYRCETATYFAHNWLRIHDKNTFWDVNSTSFFSLFKTPEVGSWLSLVVLTICLVVFIVKMKLSSNGQGLLENLNRERERILNRNTQRQYDQI